MLLTFSKESFVNDIRQGKKIHSIRIDAKRRWKPGMKIHFWKGSPRNTRSNPYPFGEKTCVSIQELTVIVSKDNDLGVNVFIDGKCLDDDRVMDLVSNDGLTLSEFKEWFINHHDSFTGRIIHWTNKLY